MLVNDLTLKDKKITEITETDASRLLEYYRQVLTKDKKITLEDVIEEIRMQHSIFIFEYKDSIIGRASLFWDKKGKKVYAEEFIIDRKFQNGMNGAEFALLLMIEIARRKYEVVRINVDPANTKAIRLFKKLGFVLAINQIEYSLTYVTSTQTFENYLPLIMQFPWFSEFTEGENPTSIIKYLRLECFHNNNGNQPTIIYKFKKDISILNIHIDRIAEGITFIENNQFVISSKLNPTEAFREGLWKHTLGITNKDNRELRATLKIHYHNYLYRKNLKISGNGNYEIHKDVFIRDLLKNIFRCFLVIDNIKVCLRNKITRISAEGQVGKTKQIYSVNRYSDNKSITFGTTTFNLRALINGNILSNIEISSKGITRQCCTMSPGEVEPPFYPDYIPTLITYPFIKTTLLERTLGGEKIAFELASKSCHALTFMKEIVVKNDNQIEIRHCFKNLSKNNLQLRLRQKFRDNWKDVEIAYPLNDSIVSQKAVPYEFPLFSRNLFINGWYCLKEGNKVFVIFWENATVKTVGWNHLPELIFELPLLPALGSIELAPIYLLYFNQISISTIQDIRDSLYKGCMKGRGFMVNPS